MPSDASQTGLSEAVLARLREVFAAAPGVEEAVLFGSRAKGVAGAGSDIDLALKGPGLSPHDLLRIANALDDLLLPYKIDLALYSQIDTPALREHIDRVGVTIFSRGGETASK